MCSTTSRLPASLASDDEYRKPVNLVPNVLRRLVYYVNPVDSLVCQPVNRQFRTSAWDELQQRLAVPKYGMFLLQSPVLVVGEDICLLIKKRITGGEDTKRKRCRLLLGRMEDLMLNAVIAYAGSYRKLTTLMLDFNVNKKWRSFSLIDRYIWLTALNLVSGECGLTLKHFVTQKLSLHSYPPEDRRGRRHISAGVIYRDEFPLEQMLAQTLNLETLYFPDIIEACKPSARHPAAAYDIDNEYAVLALLWLSEEQRLPKLRRVVIAARNDLVARGLSKVQFNQRLIVELKSGCLKTIKAIGLPGVNLVVRHFLNKSLVKIRVFDSNTDNPGMCPAYSAEKFPTEKAYFDKVATVIEECWAPPMTVWNDLHAAKYGMPARNTKHFRFVMGTTGPIAIAGIMGYITSAKRRDIGVHFLQTTSAGSGDGWFKFIFSKPFMDNVLPYFALGKSNNNTHLQANSRLNFEVRYEMTMKEFIYGGCTAYDYTISDLSLALMPKAHDLPKIIVELSYGVEIELPCISPEYRTNIFSINYEDLMNQYVVKAIRELLDGDDDASPCSRVRREVYEQLECLKFTFSFKRFDLDETDWFYIKSSAWPTQTRKVVWYPAFSDYVLDCNNKGRVTKSRLLPKFSPFELSFKEEVAKYFY